MKKIDISYSPITGRVFMGKTQEVKGGSEGIRAFCGEKQDITNKFLLIVEQFFEVGTSRISSGGEEESIFIHIKNTKEEKEKLIKFLRN